jgi:YD repeat-containing protein
MTARGGITSAYDPAGNLTQAGSDTYGWDAEGRLISVTRSGHSATYRYDGQGLRTRTPVDGTTNALLVDRTTNALLVDRTGGLPTIVEDDTAASCTHRGPCPRTAPRGPPMGSPTPWARSGARPRGRGR